MKNQDNSKIEEEIMREICKDFSDEKIFHLCKANLLEAFDNGEPEGKPNPHNLESAYQLKKELGRRKVDKSMLQELENFEEQLRKEYCM